MGDEDDADDPKAMQFAKMDVPEAYMATNDEELVLKLEQVCGLCTTDQPNTERDKTNQPLASILHSLRKPYEKTREAQKRMPLFHNHALSVLRPFLALPWNTACFVSAKERWTK